MIPYYQQCFCPVCESERPDVCLTRMDLIEKTVTEQEYSQEMTKQLIEIQMLELYSEGILH